MLYTKTPLKNLSQEEKKTLLLKACYSYQDEFESSPEFPYITRVYNCYFMPKGLINNIALERWEDGEFHCLTTAYMMKKHESVRFVWQWARKRKIKGVTQKEIDKAFNDN